MLMPGGSTEQKERRAWALSGGARTVSGSGEAFSLNSEGDKIALHAVRVVLQLRPTMCFARGDWHLRFVNKGPGEVRVTVQVRSLLGLLSVLDGGTVRPGDTWTPSPKVGLLLSNVGGLLTTKAISIRLTASDGASQEDRRRLPEIPGRTS